MRKFLVVGLCVAAAGCSDPVRPTPWLAIPDTVVLYSASRAEYTGMPSAYDFFRNESRRIEAPGNTGNWDAVLLEQGGSLVLAPADILPNVSSRAALAEVTATSLADIERAPSDTAQFKRTPVAVSAGKFFVARSRRDQCGFAGGSRYSKLKIISTDPAAGTIQFEVIHNPTCEDRSLIPPED